MKFEINSWGYYEVDINENFNPGHYYKVGEKWFNRISGMSFNISGMDYYENLKAYLDKNLNKQLRKEKLEKIHKLYDRNEKNFIH